MSDTVFAELRRAEGTIASLKSDIRDAERRVEEAEAAAEAIQGSRKRQECGACRFWLSTHRAVTRTGRVSKNSDVRVGECRAGPPSFLIGCVPASNASMVAAIERAQAGRWPRVKASEAGCGRYEP